MSFKDMMTVLFADPVLSKPATWLPQDGSGGFALTVMGRQPDVLTDFGGGQIHSETALFDVRVADVPNPAVGDRLTVGSVNYVVQSEPTADSERLIWTLNTRPE